PDDGEGIPVDGIPDDPGDGMPPDDPELPEGMPADPPPLVEDDDEEEEEDEEDGEPGGAGMELLDCWLTQPPTSMAETEPTSAVRTAMARSRFNGLSVRIAPSYPGCGLGRVGHVPSAL